MVHLRRTILGVVGVGKLSLCNLCKIVNTSPLGARLFECVESSINALEFRTCVGIRDELLGLDGRNGVEPRLVIL